MSYFQVGKRCWGIGIHQGQPFFCFDMQIADRQYHWRPNFTPKQFDFDETLRTQGLDPDYSKRQLFEKISKGGTMNVLDDDDSSHDTRASYQDRL